jgi:Baseplate J-like protein
MPLTIPQIDDRNYQQLLDEALARIPVHNPEWTNFNKSDPGVTIIEVFAFLTENLLYRSNQIPERNRVKFLSLLGVPLRPASSARGLVAFSNDRGPAQTFTLNAGLEVRAGQVPFRTELGIDVLPVEAQVYYKRRLSDPSPQVSEYYRQLYASYGAAQPTTFQLYQTVPLTTREGDEVDLGADTVDGSLWVALMVRATDKPYPAAIAAAREAIAGRTLALGIVPSLSDARSRLAPGGRDNPEGAALLQFLMPKVQADGTLEKDPTGTPVPRYRLLDSGSAADVLSEPGVVQLALPAASELRLWENLDPLEAGVGDLPPALEDTNLSERLITWVRVRPTAAVPARLLWVGINTAPVTQRAHVSNELLPAGTGEPDQSVTLTNTPVVPGSVRLTVTAQGRASGWQETDDLLSAGPEVPVPDPRLPPGSPLPPARPSEVFTLDPESGQLRFGDGVRGKRPPRGATLRADYDYGVGAAGNVGPGSINAGASLPAGIRVTNPVRTWRGARGETVAEGEKQIARYVQHRDRLVSLSDFESIVMRAPGVDIGRVEIIPAYNPELVPNEPGDAPGAVTVMVIPSYDPAQPSAPLPDKLFLDAVCAYLDPRRLVTTEIFLRGPVYKPIWISIGINVVAGVGVAQVREAVRRTALSFLAPLPERGAAEGVSQAQAGVPEPVGERKGWPLRKPVVDRELLAVVSRVGGVLSVNDVFVAEGSLPAAPQIAMSGLELPRVMGISVTVGEALGLDALRGQGAGGAGGGPGGPGGGAPGGDGGPVMLPVPTIPEEC